MENSINNNKYGFWIFVLGLCYYTLGTFTDLFSTLLIGQNPYDTLLYLGILAFLFSLYLKNNSFKVRMNVFLIPVVFCVLLVIDNFLPESIASVHSRMMDGIIQQGIIGYFCALVLIDAQEMHRAVKWCAFISFFSALSILIFPASILSLYDNLGENGYGAYMFFGFRMLVPTVLFIYLSFTETNKLYRCFAIISVLSLLIFANRGAVITVAVFFMLYLLFFASGRVRFLLIIVTAILAFTYVYLLNSGTLQLLYSYLSTKGITSRNLQLLLTSSLNETGRDYIYEDALEAIRQHLFWGTGLSGAWQFPTPGYPHNIILELCIQFGLIPAVGIVLIFCWKLLGVVKNYIDPQIGKLMLMFIVIGVVPLFFSGSYVTSFLFWFMCGFFNAARVAIKESVYND